MDSPPPPADPRAALEVARSHFASGATRALEARRDALIRLRGGLEAMEGEVLAALEQDLGKSAFDGWTSELLLVRQEIALALKRLPRWAAPSRVPVRWFHRPGRAALSLEPRGAVLVIGPWNYPVQLLLVPLVSALAAGNTVVLKPSEMAPATAAVLARLLHATLAPPLVQVLQGGPEVSQALTELPFDHLFFTGSSAVGRRVAVAAARNLVSTTLELGGVNPCIVDETADPAVTARRIAWGKFLNAGQTCLAPNHVLVHESRYGPLVEALRKTLTDFYGADGRGLQRVVNARHFARIEAMLDQGRAAHGGGADAQALHVQPTLLVDPVPGATVLRDEIFGPILPILPWRDRDAMLSGVVALPAPLALYVHSRDRGFVQWVAARTRSGGFCVNDHVVQATVPELPFGGVGASGQGRYHGRAGFEAFSNARGRFHQPAWADLPMRYPPHRTPLSLIKRMMG
ncbi:aldehyde dehydrogenase family protein [Muricoccus radiodurans]|uniref:aldehyde dehydrogenase family protein n=1 Tax=Muricoccus radiodurans TaxID=2231721 RepID=UPI003CF19F77